MCEPTRRNWIKPELIALVRSRAEEAVLETCKTGTTGAGCGIESEYCYHCGAEATS